MIPRRVAYVLNIFPKLSETFIAAEIAELVRRDVEVRILSLLPPRNEPQHEFISIAGLDKLTHYDIPAFGRLIREFQPDIIHAHFARDATEKARELTLETGIPYCFTAHGYDIFRKPPEDFNQRANNARAVITVSEANAAYITRTFGVPKSHICVIPCGIDTSFFSPLVPSQNEHPSTPTIVCVARHVEVKNLSLLLEACALLRKRNVRFHSILAGDGPLHSRLIQERASHQLDDFVQMPGAVNQTKVCTYWRQAAVGVLTSNHEGMPVCLMEAAACGVPVVATAVGGIPELVLDGVTGLLCNSGNAAEIANALQLLLGDSLLRRRMGKAARARAEQHFSIVQQVDSLLKVWSHALTGVFT